MILRVVTAEPFHLEQDLLLDKERFFKVHAIIPSGTSSSQGTDVVILQGRPRADGNCIIIAGWAVSAAKESQKTVQATLTT
jgi:hypothetical protein